MNKTLFVILLIVSVVVAGVGALLIFLNSTPYLNCVSWLRYSSDNYELFSYALQNIGKYKLGYFGGIAVTVIGAISTLVTVAVYVGTKTAK